MNPEIYSLIETALKYALWPLLLIIIIGVFHQQIKAFIDKIISSSKFQFGTNGLVIEASENEVLIHNESNDENGKLDPLPNNKEKDIKDTHWYLPVTNLLEENKIPEAKSEFNNFVQEHKDDINYDMELAFYFYVLFKHTKDEDILNELLFKIKKSTEIEIKNEFIKSYIYCLEHIHQYTKAITFLNTIISETEDLKIKSAYSILLSRIYLLNLELEKSEKEIIDVINNLSSENIERFEDELYQAYLQLADIEKEKNDKINYALCLDKALDFKPSSESTLFSAAYQASQFNFLDSLAISNYSYLETLAPNNEATINNLGVAANKLELKIIACDFYRKAKNLNSSISYSNIGYKLLEAGCAKEAEELAREAIEQKNPDKNNYELLAKIKKETEDESEKWKKYKSKSNEKQKFIRSYVEKKYNRKTQFPNENNWIDDKDRNAKITITEKTLLISWQDPIRDIKFHGTISNATFQGIYITSPLQTQTLLGSTATTSSAHCFGFYDDVKDHIMILSTESNNDLKIILNKSGNV